MAEKQTKEEIDAGINAYEDEHCKHLEKIGKMADELGITVPGESQLPELNPDGSEVEPDKPE